jgi:hypothetical protein
LFDARTSPGLRKPLAKSFQQSSTAARRDGALIDSSTQRESLRETARTSPGLQLLVAGVDGTTVNGKSVDGFYNVRHVQLNLGDGNDSATINQLSIRGRLDINAGDGDDEIAIRRSEVNSLTVDTGGGDDSMELDSTKVYRKARVAMGAGDDRLTVIDS